MMEKIYNITYIDAYYTYAEKLTETKLSIHEAYGYLHDNNNSFILYFIKKESASKNKTIDFSQNIVKGLLIPKTALVSASKRHEFDPRFDGIKILSTINVVWSDISYVANNPLYTCPLMHSKGALYKIEKDHIVLKDPETIRMSPLPNIAHPQKKPTYYMIPKSLITNITIA